MPTIREYSTPADRAPLSTGDAVPGEEAGQAARAGLHAALGEDIAQLVQEDRGPRLVGCQDKLGLRLDPVLGVIAA